MKTFITIILILLILRWLLKPFLRFAVFTTINKMANEAMKRQQYNNQQQYRKSEGTISVDYVPEKTKSSKPFSKDKNDEYVDFEEIK